MNESLSLEEQLAATLEAAADLNARAATTSARQTERPEPGDVFLSRRTVDNPVQWLILERDDHRGPSGQALVVPIDEHPYAGSHDLELAPESLGGPAVVRCALDAWLDLSELEPGLRTGKLSELELGRVRRKLRAIENGTVEPSLLEEVVDGDPEYERWREHNLEPAREALTGSDREVSGAGPSRHWWRPAVAAAIFLIAVLPLAWQAYRLSQQLGLEQGRIADLEKERQTLTERITAAEAGRENSDREVGRLEQALTDAVEASKQALAEQQESFEARLRRAFDDRAVVNVPSYVLGKLARTRSGQGEPELIAPGDARRFTLSLEVPDPEPYPRYRLSVIDTSDEGEVWKTDDLIKVGGKWLRLDLPSDLFEAGEYELRIYGLTSGEATLLEERYTVRFER